MQARVRFHGIAVLIGTALLMFSGVASAQLDKQETKCANSINKGAAKVAKAQAGDNASCVKNGSKGKLTTSIETCLTGDVKGKVAKAISKIKTGDCSGAPSFLPGLVTSSSAIGDIMKEKDLELIHDIFGSDLDQSVSTDKAAGKCQAAIAKAVGKCQDAKLGTFNGCKKSKLKAADTDIEGCLGTGAGTIEDTKGKIAKKCGGDFDIGKKCGGQDLNALLPGLAPNVGAGSIDVAIECRVCLALNALDGLGRDCDLFDDGLANGSCGEGCGDGVIQTGEECDAGNIADGDGCSSICLLETTEQKLVFAFAGPVFGDMGGLLAADAICQSAADGALLGGTYKAWLSDGTDSPSTTFNQALIPYRLVDGTLIASGWADLTDGTLHNPINKTETGALAQDPRIAWTNVATDGTPFSSDIDCDDWTTATIPPPPGELGATGSMNTSGSGWTAGGSQVCPLTLGLYCFEQ